MQAFSRQAGVAILIGANDANSGLNASQSPPSSCRFLRGEKELHGAPSPLGRRLG